MLYFTVSTGIGGGVIIDGKLHRGEHAWAGEMGHMTLKPDGSALSLRQTRMSGSSCFRAFGGSCCKGTVKNPIPKPLPSNYVVSILKDIPRNQITARMWPKQYGKAIN